MKKIAILLIAIILLSSCKKDEDKTITTNTTTVDLIGDWHLIEVLADPGDGSGTFAAVESDKTITFHTDGTLTSNGSLCDMSLDINNPTSGAYSIADSTFSSNDCNIPEYGYRFEQEASILIINYPCIEPCRAKYQKQ